MTFIIRIRHAHVATVNNSNTFVPQLAYSFDCNMHVGVESWC